MNASENLKMNMQRVPTIDDCVLIRPVGAIDSYNTVSFRKQVLQVIESGNCRLIFDMTEVPYMASMPFAECVTFLKKVKERNGNMAMVNLRPQVRHVVQLLGFTLLLNVMDSMEEALELVSIVSKPRPPFPKTFSCPLCGLRMKAARSGRYRCSECKTILRVEESGNVRPVYALEENDYELIPEKTEQAIRLLGQLSRMVRGSGIDLAEKTAFKKTLGQIVVNLYQREVKDMWAELEEVRS
jgi:anti-anti-sigma factor